MALLVYDLGITEYLGEEGVNGDGVVVVDVGDDRALVEW
jgi:hypothetical protein